MKKTILTIIITAVICISGTAFAVTKINANQVSYIDSSNNEINVETALNNVYSNLDTKMMINTFGTPLYSSSVGDRIGKRETSKELTKGKYIVVDAKGSSWANAATSWPNYSTSNVNLGAGYENLSCSNGCVIRQLGEHWDRVRASGKTGDNYLHYSVLAYVYYVEVTANTDTITAYIDETASIYGGTSVTLIAIPIN